MSLLIAAGKHPKYIAAQAGHSSAGFTLDRYGHLFDTLPITPVEWPEDLLWPGGLPNGLAGVLSICSRVAGLRTSGKEGL